MQPRQLLSEAVPPWLTRLTHLEYLLVFQSVWREHVTANNAWCRGAMRIGKRQIPSMLLLQLYGAMTWQDGMSPDRTMTESCQFF